MSQSSPFAAMRRLHERGSRSRGLVVDLAVEAALIKACFDTSQARDERGRWSSGGGIRVDEVAPVQIADAGEGMSDAGGILPAAANDQAAQPIPAPSATIPPPAQRSGNVSEYTPADAAKLPPPPVGSKYLTLADGSVPWTAPYHEIKGGAILVPNTVSIEDNVRAGEKILGDYNKLLRRTLTERTATGLAP